MLSFTWRLVVERLECCAEQQGWCLLCVCLLWSLPPPSRSRTPVSDWRWTPVRQNWPPVPCLEGEAPIGEYFHQFKGGRANLQLNSSAGFPAYQIFRNAAWWLLNVQVSPVELPEAVIAHLRLPWSSIVMAGNQLGLSPHGQMWQPHTLVWGRAWPCWNVKLYKIFKKVGISFFAPLSNKYFLAFLVSTENKGVCFSFHQLAEHSLTSSRIYTKLSNTRVLLIWTKTKVAVLKHCLVWFWSTRINIKCSSVSPILYLKSFLCKFAAFKTA